MAIIFGAELTSGECSDTKESVSQSVGACAAAARCRIYLGAVLLRSPDGHPPGRHMAHPHPSKMTIHLTQPRVIGTPLRASPTSRFSRRENPPSRITHRESSHMTLQSHLALTYHTSNRSHSTLPEQPSRYNKTRCPRLRLLIISAR